VDEYCKISVDGVATREELAAALAESTGGKLDSSLPSSEIATSWATIDVVRNSDYEASRRNEWPDGFLFFPYFVEIYIGPGADLEGYRRNVGKLLQALWDRGLKAVAACDFEDQLPMRGGYKTRKW